MLLILLLVVVMAEDTKGGVPEYKKIGCWKDAPKRAIPTLEGADKINLKGNYWRRSDAVIKCYMAALAKGYHYFAVQNGGWCASSSTAGNTYKVYGPSKACKSNGKGGPWANQIYRINGRCVKTDGGNAKGACCTFPFIYKKKQYRECTTTNHNRLWCATKRNYGKYKLWGNCPAEIQLKAPIITCEANVSRIQFKCRITRMEKTASVYEVNWYQQPITGGAKLVKSEMLTGSSSVAFMTNGDIRLYHLGVNIYTEVRSWPVNNVEAKTTYVKSNTYFAGIKFDRTNLKLLESAKPIKLNVTATIPILCENRTKDCKISVHLIPSTTDIMISKCTLVFMATSNISSSQTFTVIAKRNFVDDGSRNLKITQNIITSPGVSTNGDWSGAIGTSIKISTTSVSTGRCTSSGDPHIRTFDGKYFNHYRLGDYTLVESKARMFQVQARTHQCASVACNCGVAVREDNDVLVVDMCKGYNSATVRYASNQEPKRGTYISRSRNGKIFILQFRSGAFVRFVAKKWFGHNYYADITIQIPPDDYSKTQGLCGVIDKHKGNDMTAKNGKVFPRSCGRQACSKFTESWKLSRAESLFYYNSAVMKCLPKVTSNFCQCSNGSYGIDRKRDDTCNTGYSKATFRAKLTAGYKKMVFPGQVKCDQERNVTSDGAVIVLPPVGKEDLYTYIPPRLLPIIPSFPTKRGVTKKQAKEVCRTKMEGSDLFKACKEAIGVKFNIEGFLEQCIADIEILDDETAAVVAATDAMKSDCEEVIMRDPTTWIPDASGKMQPPKDLRDKICPNQCSGSGKCIKSNCVCDKGFVTDDCSIRKGAIPSDLAIANHGLCDIRRRNCSAVMVSADNLVPGVIVCGFEDPQIWNEDPVKQPAVLLSFAEVLCPVPKTREVVIDKYLTTKFGHPIITYHVSLSNGNGTFSISKQLIVYDSKCVKCTEARKKCFIKKNTCLINRYCFRNGEADPKDTKCKVCDPARSKSGFVVRKNTPAGCEVHPCDKAKNGGCNQICNKRNESHVCSCRTGFVLGKDGKNCSKLHPCDKAKNGGCNQICNKRNESHVCSCRSGFVLGKDEKSCSKGRVPTFNINIQIIQGYPTYFQEYNGFQRPFPGLPSFFNGLSASRFSFPGAGWRPRVYVELKLDTDEENSKFVPVNCIATPTEYRIPHLHYEIITNGKPVDATFIQHTAADKVYRFSVSPFNMAGTPKLAVHCKSLVICKYKQSGSDTNAEVENEANDPQQSYYTVYSTGRIVLARGSKHIETT